jgi:hypothetical protein
MAKSPKFRAFAFSRDDPLAAEHRDVSAWVEDALASNAFHRFYDDVALGSLPSGKKLLDAAPEQARRYVLAAIAQALHWNAQADRIRGPVCTINAVGLPGWDQVWGRRRQACAVVAALMRRGLPFQKEDILAILGLYLAGEQRSALESSLTIERYSARLAGDVPIGHIVRALERYAAGTAVDAEARKAMKAFAARLRSSADKDARRHGTTVEQLCLGAPQKVAGGAPPPRKKPAPRPAPAGTPAVLDQFKRSLGMLPDKGDRPATVLEPDRFPLLADSPLRREHELLSACFAAVVGTGHSGYRHLLTMSEPGRAVLSLKRAARGRALLAATERHVNTLLAPRLAAADWQCWQARDSAGAVVIPIAQTAFSLSRGGLFDFLLYLSVRPARGSLVIELLIPKLLAQVEQEMARAPLSEGERYVLSLFRASLVCGPPLGTDPPQVARLTQWIGDGAAFCLAPGEAWSDAVNDDLGKMKPARRRDWVALFTHALGATAARPSARWLKTAAKLVGAVGKESLQRALKKWLPLVGRGRSLPRLGLFYSDARGRGDVIDNENANCLRGLLWLAQALPRPEELLRTLAAVALTAYRKVPGVGPRAVKVGNAAVYALSGIRPTEAVGQLAMLKVRVKFGTAQKEIEKAFNQAAGALGLPRDEIEEMGVPAYGLSEVGLRRETLGDYRAELAVAGSRAELRWFDARGKAIQSVPAKAKSEHREDLGELQQSLKDIRAMLPAQRDRIDSMFLAEKSWPIAAWKERYLDHPLVGTIARRLLWCVDGTAATFAAGEPADIRGRPLAHGKTAEITLWHPIGRSVEKITAWRRRLEELGIAQPFKQAHREVYLLTDAERRTGTYANRFAAHVLRQHQFNALCAARGWKNKLRLMVDADYPPAAKELPHWGLRAEFWIEGLGDDYGRDTNESGVFLLLATDQVRFYRTEARQHPADPGGRRDRGRAAAPRGDGDGPLPLQEVPPLVFSEIMRDVDLFVGVASVGNDPTWQDGGPAGRYRDYWQGYCFGELSGTATTRRQVLERLVPRLRIAARCSFSDRFLVVRGDKRTYKVHLGSGNVLMEPNDQYLCIVPDSPSRAKPDDLFLPFEGDNTLSIIISKAILLAEDAKIKDPTIVQQIDR